jgi:membrane protein DedA with SNARE-associated domain
MHWWKFLFFNAAGGIAWAIAVGLVAFYGGKAAADAIAKYGAYAAVVIVVVALVGWLGLHFGKKKLEDHL